MRRSIVFLACISSGLSFSGYVQASASNLQAQHFLAQGITMTLSNIEPLSGTSSLIWQEVTANQLVVEITDILGSELVDAVVVAVSLVSQDPPYGGVQAVIEEELTVTFEASIFIQSVVKDHDVNRYIVGAFNSDTEKVFYLDTLKSTGDIAFLGASDVSVTPAELVSRVETPSTNNGDGGGLSAGIIVGVVLVSIGAIALGAFYLYTPSRPASDARTKTVSDMETGDCADAPRNPTKDAEDESLYRYIGNLRNVMTLDTCDELEDDDSRASPSTLSTTEFVTKVKTHRNVTFSPSVYESHSQQSEITPQSGFIQSTYESYLTSEAKKLFEFEVDAPPGDLGLVLGTCEEGVAVVATLKQFSPLMDKVKVGDRLVALDGKDVSTMIATTVKRFLVSKEFNQNRRLTFARPQE